jgi:murein DD-endopeptidase MepM/ murein hydrolase activator NlpD
MPDQLNNTHNDLFFQAAAPHTVVPPRSPEKIATYTVQEGDTVTTIAYQFDLSPETIMWSNPNIEENPHWLQVGQEITILPTNGVYHQVGSSDTIEKIASTYKVDPLTIIDYPLNHIDPLEPTVTAGEWVVVPGGSKPFVPTVVRGVNTYQGEIPTHALAGSGIFAWPLSGRISQGYWSVHRAIDIESPVGSPVAAADSGFVTAAGWDDTGYGYFVIIDHGNGLQTMYAHLNAYYVEAGDNVYAGQTIGEVGTTGRASGPHLHFEVREGSLQLNPSQFLP